MNDYARSRYMSTHVSGNEGSESFSRMRQHYWTTKQAVFRKLGKKEDDCIIASDLELDLKLELFQTIEESFLTLLRVLENYQDKLCALAQEENVLGRFLKESGKQDKTGAGKAMCSAGKALSYSAQQSLTLRGPLVRLYEEVETFQYRAIVDTLKTVQKMEKARTTYRGTLMWMKDVSQQLDPDTGKQMEKFRKVQNQVRKEKQRFDKMKLDTLQKVDLLSFSRCNLFSQALSTYQTALLNVSKKVACSSNSVAAMTKGYQHYEFSTLKELSEASRKLAEETSDMKSLTIEDKDTLLFFEAEYHDEVDGKSNCDCMAEKEKGGENQAVSQTRTSSVVSHLIAKEHSDTMRDGFEGKDHGDLLHLCGNADSTTLNTDSALSSADMYNKKNAEVSNDLLTNSSERSPTNDDLSFLNDVFNSVCDDSSTLSTDEGFGEWQSVFDHELVNSSKVATDEQWEKTESLHRSFLPSQLLKRSNELGEKTAAKGLLTKQLPSTGASFCNTENSIPLEKTKRGKQDMSAWFNLFADLDPLANPDSLGKEEGSQDDRSC